MAILLLIYSFREKMPMAAQKDAVFDPTRFLFETDEEKPVMGFLVTHHKTGTMMFQEMFQRLCPLFKLDFQQVRGPTRWDRLADASNERYFRFANSTQRMVTVMQGFDEHCSVDPNSKCDRFDAGCWMRGCSLIKMGKNPDEFQPTVHVVRNPVEILISAYLYHNNSGQWMVENGHEAWLGEPKPDALTVLDSSISSKYKNMPFYKALQGLDDKDALKVEFNVLASGMYRAARLYQSLQEKPYVLQMHFEDFKADYAGSMQKVFAHLKMDTMFGMEKLMEVANLFDPKAVVSGVRSRLTDSHVTEGKYDKEPLRKAMFDDPTLNAVMLTLGTSQGYEKPFPYSK
ncbi:hypothetical protein BSKO_06346 [Bryopsis sp. KO-2023]|nr:hypothetical protein BSKO_06346 [Bryopsis sp. KO-2023]